MWASLKSLPPWQKKALHPCCLAPQTQVRLYTLGDSTFYHHGERNGCRGEVMKL